MRENFFYIIKDDFFDKFTKLGSTFKYNKAETRPVFCCFQDRIHNSLFWAIPTGSVKGKNLEKISRYIQLSEKDIRHAYYHIGYTNKKAIYYISSVFPIISKYILREYTVSGKPLELKRNQEIIIIRQKLLKILNYEKHFPNRLETHITDVKNELLKEVH